MLKCRFIPMVFGKQNSNLLDDLGHMKLNLVIADPAYMLLCVGKAIGPSGFPNL